MQPRIENSYKYITQLANAIENGGKYYRRGRFDIGLGGYDMGYQLSVDDQPICEVNFGFGEFRENGDTAQRYGLDIYKIKSIFEKTADTKLDFVNEYDEDEDEMRGYRTKTPKLNIRKMF